tara:strand:- start:39 stop:245 length:207 start_codon:yes stop_codon:yes gene_type:complete
MVRENFKKIRRDTHIGNLDLPKSATNDHRKDTHLGTLLDENNVTTKTGLEDKIRGNNRLAKFNQKKIK